MKDILLVASGAFAAMFAPDALVLAVGLLSVAAGAFGAVRQ